MPKMILSAANCCIFHSVKSLWNKSKHFLLPALKFSIVIACILTLYFQWQAKPLTHVDLWNGMGNISISVIIIMLILSLCSWIVESKRWQIMVQDVEVLRFRESVIQSLTAQTASFITPLRAGEFAYKCLYYDPSKRKEVLKRVFYSNAIQMGVTVMIGVLGLCFFLNTTSTNKWMLAVAIAIAYMFIASHPFIFKKAGFSRKTWFQVLGLSVLRYVIFGSNWLLVLAALVPETSIDEWLSPIAVNYLVVSSIPMFQVFDIPVKWTTASFIFNGSLVPTAYVLVAATLVWITNTLFPTLVGCFMLPLHKLRAA
jgi:hypothetical protein